MNFDVVSIVKFSSGFASSHLVKYSMVVMMYFSPHLLALIGNGPKKSMAYISNGKLGFIECKGISFFHNGQPIL